MYAIETTCDMSHAIEVSNYHFIIDKAMTMTMTKQLKTHSLRRGQNKEHAAI